MKHGFFSLKQFLSHSNKFPPGFFLSIGIFSFTGILIERDLRLSPSLVPLGGEQYHSSLRLKGGMTHFFNSK